MVYAPWRKQLHDIIFEAETPIGKLFDVVLLISICLSIAAVVLESVAAIEVRWGSALRIAEWIFTILFTIEYILRLLTVRQPTRYALSFFGIIDLLAIAPTYLALFVTGTQSLVVVRAFRLLRIFRVFKFTRYLGEMNSLIKAIRATRAKIIVFLVCVMAVVLIMGTLMYVIEGAEHGFTSIPKAVYWAIVTVTTVGYGDIAPQTIAGRTIAALGMVLGYSLIIIPTGIFSVELVQAAQQHSTRHCPHCSREGHDRDAIYCKYCAGKL